MNSAPTVPNISTWATLLVTLGANLGSTLIKNTQVGQLINLAAIETAAVVNQIQQAKAATGSTASDLAVPLFVDSVLGGLSTAVIAKQISPVDAAEISKAVAAMAQEDLVAKTTVDYSTIGPIAPLP